MKTLGVILLSCLSALACFGQTCTFTLINNSPSVYAANCYIDVEIVGQAASGRANNPNMAPGGAIYWSYPTSGFGTGNTWEVVFLCGGTNIGYYTFVPPASASFTAYVDALPATTNITLCVGNTTGGNVSAFWNASGDNLQGGPQMSSETLAPGASDCRTFTLTLPLDGSDSITSGWTPLNLNNGNVDPNSDNPFGTNGSTTQTFGSGSSAFGGTNTMSATGANGGSGNTYNYSTNITYGSGTNLALDSTLRSGFGQLHSDNLNVINGESVLHNDSVTLHNDNISLQNQFAGITNDLGQIVTYTYRAATNTDQLPTLISIVTNNASQNAASIKSAIAALPTTNTDPVADGQLQMVNSNLVNLANGLTNEMVNITNIFGQATDITNADLATETTQLGISNLLAAMGTNGPFVDTNDPLFTATYTNGVGFAGATNATEALAASAPYTSGPESTMASFIASITGFEQDDVNDAADMTFDVNAYVGIGQPMIIDFNPLDNPDMADIFAHVKAFWVWLLAFGYLLRVSQDAVKAIEICNAARGSNASATKGAVAVTTNAPVIES